MRTKQLPTLDDAFAQEASEFDTLDELRADLRARLERVKRLEQGMQARDNVLEALLGQVEIPLPERTVDDEIRNRRESLAQQLAANGLDLDAYLASQDESLEAHEAHTKVDVERDLRAQFVLDAVVVKEELGIEEAELTEYIVRRASRAGVSPDDYAQQLVRSGTVPLAVADVLRSKALAYVLENAVVTDASGRTVDLNRLEQDVAAGSSLTARSPRLVGAPTANSAREYAAEHDRPVRVGSLAPDNPSRHVERALKRGRPAKTSR